MKKNYKIKKTISMNLFVTELGENFSDHVKDRLLELELRCVLTRKEDFNTLDIKHVEHIQHDCSSGFEDDSASSNKEYAYGQFCVIDDELYFSEKCTIEKGVEESPIVRTIYTALKTNPIILSCDTCGKKVNDDNIDYIIDTLLTVFPNVSEAHLNMVKDMISRAKVKSNKILSTKPLH